MKIKISSGNIIKYDAQVIVVNVFEDEDGLSGQLAKLDSALDGEISRLIKQKEIKGKFKEITPIFTLGKIAAVKVLIIGLGKKSEVTLDKIRICIAEICQYIQSKNGNSSLEIAYLADIAGFDNSELGQAMSEGALLGVYCFNKHISKKPDRKEIDTLNIILPKKLNLNLFTSGVNKGIICAQAVSLARDLVNEPANYMTPSILTEITRTLASKYNFDIQVFEKDFMQAEGMGGLLGVAQGSNELPKFILLKYSGSKKKTLDIALVGKGITFDSGGISIKPSENMGDMKGDMAGGAAVIAAMTAIAQLKPSLNVTAIIPATENMPSGTAMRPGDVITQKNGKTVEIITTDAEGRLILADAICYARKIGAKKIIDVATLTGACRVALGDICTGVLGNDQTFTQTVISAGDKVGECMWQLPLKEEYKELNKSEVADLKNSGGRYAGTISAAWFLAEFAETTPWVHLDIAGTSMTDKAKGYYQKGATGVSVRTLINLVLSLAPLENV